MAAGSSSYLPITVLGLSVPASGSASEEMKDLLAEFISRNSFHPDGAEVWGGCAEGTRGLLRWVEIFNFFFPKTWEMKALLPFQNPRFPFQFLPLGQTMEISGPLSGSLVPVVPSPPPSSRLPAPHPQASPTPASGRDLSESFG